MYIPPAQIGSVEVQFSFAAIYSVLGGGESCGKGQC